MEQMNQFEIIYEKAIAQIRDFGLTLEELRGYFNASMSNDEPVNKIACIGSFTDFEFLSQKLTGKTSRVNQRAERIFFYNDSFYVFVPDKKPKGHYPKCNSVLVLGGYLSPLAISIIEDFQDQQEAYLINLNDFIKTIKP